MKRLLSTVMGGILLAAAACGIASCGVRYGYALEGELEAAGADYIADDTDELLTILMK